MKLFTPSSRSEGERIAVGILDADRSVVGLIREQVKRNPEALAVKDKVGILSYGELDRLSNQIANRLLRQGLQMEEIVGLVMDRSSLFVVAALGVLKAGGSYLPIDRNSPESRIIFQILDSKTRFLIGGESELTRFSRSSDFLLKADEEWSELADEDASEQTVPHDPCRRAYMIYTSGSTGMPKGVEIEHHSLSNLISFYQERFNLTPSDRITMIANVSFDISAGELWPTFCSGAALLIPGASLTSDLDGLMLWLCNEKATISFVPTALVELIFQRSWPKEMALRFLITGGDTLRLRPPKGFCCPLINCYGPTENTVMSTSSIVSSEDGGQHPPIGTAITNVQAYVLDDALCPVRHGVEGELYLGGEQVARGYWNRPDLTAERFLPDPFVMKSGARMYRTGDWVRWGSHGELDFLGRRDDQVQIYGQRFELGEIEHALLTHPSVIQVCCRPHLENGNVTGVIAHIVTSKEIPGFKEELHNHLLKLLPIAAVPEKFVFHKNFPMTPQGKLDRTLLDSSLLTDAPKTASNSSSTQRQQELRDLWLAMLPEKAKNQQIHDLEDNFFSLGGDSLKAAILLISFEKITGKRFSFTSFLKNPSLKGFLQESVKNQNADNQSIITFQSEGDRPPIYFVYYLTGDVAGYLNLVELFDTTQPAYAFPSPALYDMSKLPKSMEEAAAEVLERLRKIPHKYPPTLFGYSWGGWLAFEVARQWCEQEEGIPFVCMVGTNALPHPLSLGRRVGHFFRWFPSWYNQLQRDHGKRMLRLLGMLMRIFRGGGSRIEELPSSEPDWLSLPLAREHLELVKDYHPIVKTPFPIQLFREVQDYTAIAYLEKLAHPLRPFDWDHENDCGWEQLTGCPTSVHWIDANHLNILKEPAVNCLYNELRSALDLHYSLGKNENKE